MSCACRMARGMPASASPCRIAAISWSPSRTARPRRATCSWLPLRCSKRMKFGAGHNRPCNCVDRHLPSQASACIMRLSFASRRCPHMMSLQAYLAFVIACIALALLPGPIVSLLIPNGLRYGTRGALINVAGAQAGLAIVIGIVAIGLTSLMATMGYWFDWVRFAGAAYLVWLGIKLIRNPVEGVSVDEKPAPPRGGFFLQGFLVLLSNPKVLVFFGAFIPPFMDMNQPHLPQVALLGVTFMGTAAMTDA